MKIKSFRLIASVAATLAAFPAHAEGWCDLVPGWSVVTHGGKSDNIYILGQFQGAPNGIWISIASPTIGKANIAMALGAQFADKNLSIYVDSPSFTCANFPNWAAVTEVRHIRVID